jgi:hypothetical protein
LILVVQPIIAGSSGVAARSKIKKGIVGAQKYLEAVFARSWLPKRRGRLLRRRRVITGSLQGSAGPRSRSFCAKTARPGMKARTKANR